MTSINYFGHQSTIWAMPMVTTNPVQKSTLFSAKKTTLLTRKRAFYLTDGRERVLGSWVHDKFTLAPFVIAIGHGLDGCQRIR